MRILNIPKGNGKFRRIYAPNDEEKKALWELMPQLIEIANKVCIPHVVQGFMRGMSPVTNALAHLNKQFTLCFDLSNFFDTVTWRHVQGILPDDMVDLVIVDGAARQGLPTSPIVANIAASKMDEDIIRYCAGSGTVYTRYADDLSFSFNDPTISGQLVVEIPKIVQKHRFKINEAKTRLQNGQFVRRIITGVAVDGDKIYPTRRARRKLRAAMHQGNPGSTHGLREWCKLKAPKNYTAVLQQQMESLQRMLFIINRDHIESLSYGKESRRIIIGDPCEQPRHQVQRKTSKSRTPAQRAEARRRRRARSRNRPGDAGAPAGDNPIQP